MTEADQETRYTIIQDQDSHSYLCPADKADEAKE